MLLGESLWTAWGCLGSTRLSTHHLSHLDRILHVMVQPYRMVSCYLGSSLHCSRNYFYDRKKCSWMTTVVHTRFILIENEIMYFSLFLSQCRNWRESCRHEFIVSQSRISELDGPESIGAKAFALQANPSSIPALNVVLQYHHSPWAPLGMAPTLPATPKKRITELWVPFASTGPSKLFWARNLTSQGSERIVAVKGMGTSLVGTV